MCVLMLERMEQVRSVRIQPCVMAPCCWEFRLSEDHVGAQGHKRVVPCMRATAHYHVHGYYE